MSIVNVTRSTASLARKSAMLAHVSSNVPVAASAAQSRTLSSTGAAPSVSSLSSATFLGATYAARKITATERRLWQEGEAPAEVHWFLKAALQSRQRALEAEKAAKQATEVCLQVQLLTEFVLTTECIRED